MTDEQREKYRASARAWKARNREAVAEHNRRYRERHPERVRAAVRAWIAEHREGIAAIRRRWRERNPGAAAGYALEYQRENREKCNAASRRWAAENPRVRPCPGCGGPMSDRDRCVGCIRCVRFLQWMFRTKGMPTLDLVTTHIRTIDPEDLLLWETLNLKKREQKTRKQSLTKTESLIFDEKPGASPSSPEASQ